MNNSQYMTSYENLFENLKKEVLYSDREEYNLDDSYDIDKLGPSTLDYLSYNILHGKLEGLRYSEEKIRKLSKEYPVLLDWFYTWENKKSIVSVLKSISSGHEPKYVSSKSDPSDYCRIFDSTDKASMFEIILSVYERRGQIGPGKETIQSIDLFSPGYIRILTSSGEWIRISENWGHCYPDILTRIEITDEELGTRITDSGQSIMRIGNFFILDLTKIPVFGEKDTESGVCGPDKFLELTDSLFTTRVRGELVSGTDGKPVLSSFSGFSRYPCEDFGHLELQRPPGIFPLVTVPRGNILPEHTKNRCEEELFGIGKELFTCIWSYYVINGERRSIVSDVAVESLKNSSTTENRRKSMLVKL